MHCISERAMCTHNDSFRSVDLEHTINVRGKAHIFLLMLSRFALKKKTTKNCCHFGGLYLEMKPPWFFISNVSLVQPIAH